MPRFHPRMSPDVTHSIAVKASPETVYDLVGDVPNAPDWAIECVRCRWLKGATGPAVGARFMGFNRNGVFRWISVNEVKVADRGRNFTWEVMGNMSRWEYRIEPTSDGCRVTESTWDLRGPIAKYIVAPVLTGIRDRRRANEANIAMTLQRLKTAAEA